MYVTIVTDIISKPTIDITNLDNKIKHFIIIGFLTCHGYGL